MKTETADRIVAALVKDISDRRGLKHEWEAIDASIQKEIRQRWREIILAESLGDFTP